MEELIYGGLTLTLVGGSDFLLYQRFVPAEIVDDFLTRDNYVMMGLQEGTTALGAAVLEDLGLEIRLRWIAVGEPLRGAGIGGQFLDLIIMRLEEMGAEQLTMSWMPGTAPQLRPLLEKRRFRIIETGIGRFVFNLSEILENRHLAGSCRDVRCYRDVAGLDRQDLFERIRSRGVDFYPLPPARNTFDDKLTGICYEEGNAVGMILAVRGEDILHIPYVVYTGKNPMGPVQLLRFIFRQAKENLSPETEVRIDAVTPALTRFGKSLLNMPAEMQLGAQLML